MRWLADWIEAHAFPCIVKQTLGVNCPFCGFQRSLAALFRGDMVQSFHYYPAMIPLGMSLLGLLFVKSRNMKEKYINWTVSINASIIIISTLINNIL